eukprot:2060371-Pyramimonas_sp.AAC.1
MDPFTCVFLHSTSFRGPIGSSTEGPRSGIHMRPPTQHSVPRPHREVHLRLQWRCPHAVTLPSTAFRGPIGSSTE